VASLFREDVSFSGVKTAVDSLSFEIAVARELKAGGFQEVLIPEFYVIHNQNSGKESLGARLQAVGEERLKVWQQVTPMVAKLVALDAELEQKARAKNQAEVDSLTQEINSLRSDLNPISEPLAKLDQRFTDLMADLQKPDAVSGLSGLARLLRAEAIRAVNPHYLHAKVVVMSALRPICPIFSPHGDKRGSALKPSTRHSPSARRRSASSLKGVCSPTARRNAATNRGASSG
jgi:hypothetical protein